MSRRTRPRDPLRHAARRARNEELRERVHTRFVAMYSMLRAKHSKKAASRGTPADVAGAEITDARAREMAADYACANRAQRRAEFGERSDGRFGAGATRAVPKGRRRKRRR